MVATLEEPSSPELEAMRFLLRQARTPRLRSIRQFAEDEITVPSGLFVDSLFRCDRQPFIGLLFDEMDEGPWNRFVILGPSQSGKSLSGFVIPCLYHLFEIRETVIQGVVNMEMAADKWREDLLPVIQRTRYAAHLPRSGPGSRGGQPEAIKFTHGPTLKYMSGGGGDKRRAYFTARTLIVTETDELDKPGSHSEEADKLTQMEQRTVQFDDDNRIYLESTVTIETGRTWREYQAGTESRIAVPCPKCRKYVSPEREQLVGWQEAKTEEEARRNGHFICPACRHPFTDKQRLTANGKCKLLHRGQTISKSGRIRGKRPDTRTLGFRWSAFNNLFWKPGSIAAREWRARLDPNEENAEREMCQFVWAIPYQPPDFDLTPLVEKDLRSRLHREPRGLVPAGADYLTAHADLGKRLLHWMAVAWRAEGRGYVVDYGIIEIASDDLGVETATMVALREFKERMLAGFARSEDEPMIPQFAWIDSGWPDSKDVVYQFCRADPGDRFLPTIGRGETQRRMRRYLRPKKTGNEIVYVGEEYHFSKLRADRLFLVEVNSDYYKSWIHERLACKIDSESALTFFNATPNEHIKLVKHLTAERRVEEQPPGKPLIIRWETLRRANHWLDTLYNCAAEAHHAGVRLLGPEQPLHAAADKPRRRRGLTTPDGRPFFVLDRN